MQDQPAQIVQRTLLLATALPLLLVSLIGAIFNRMLFVMSRANNNLRQAADMDSLTRLSNRAAFYRRGRDLFDHVKNANLSSFASDTGQAGSEKQMSLIMIDIDHFKDINDQLGHLAGDRALMHISDIINKCCREHDMPARWGGEEFAILLEEADRATAVRVAERIRQTAYEEPFVWGGQALDITLSAGVTEFVHQDQKLEDIVLRADLALYHAKTSGRNRVHAPHIIIDEQTKGHEDKELVPMAAKHQTS
ncbi:MAG: GGDEF domain-containing protein [Cohaesibacter sp.]|nr:GGDEF domain-containing protein [Cohaesibacter sp.]